jgi:glyoxylase-like metal-dependent hydrolase (beta-lactamase superfamily II)
MPDRLRYLAAAAMFLAYPCNAAEEIYPGYSWLPSGNGVYVHSQDDALAGPIDGNSVVIVGGAGVLVVDTHINPAVTRAVITKIRAITDKPVTHVVNTHWHDDHTNGNYVYRDAFPDAAIVSHRATLASLETEWQAMEDQRRAAYASVDIGELRRAAEELEESDPVTAIGYLAYAGYIDALGPELAALELVYPDTVFDDSLRVDLGERTVDLRWMGRGNTDGDVVVWLEDDRLLIAGDIVVAPIPYAFDSPMTDWIATLTRIAALDALTIIPGHGPVQRDDRYLERLRLLLQDTVSAVQGAHDDGIAFDRLAESIDLDARRLEFTGNDPVRDWAWQSFFLEPGLKSAWTSLGYPVPGVE